MARLSVDFCGSQYQKISLWNASVCHYFPVSKNFMLQRVRSRFFTDVFFVPQNSGTSLGNCSVVCFRKSAVGKKFMEERGGVVKVFCRNYFVSQCRKAS